MDHMTFYTSSSVKLLFDFWDVHGPAGMLLSVAVVLLLSFLYELLKAGRLWISSSQKAKRPASEALQRSCHSPELQGATSESSLAPLEVHQAATNSRKSWLVHGVQTMLHVVQLTLGYMLMLCVMSYNTWIFLAIIAGSALGYYILFPLLEVMQHRGCV